MIHVRTWCSSPTRAWRHAVASFAIALALPVACAAAERELPPPPVRAWQTGLLRADRLQHASLAWTLGLGLGLASHEPVAAIAGPALLGLAKEFADRPRFDRTDLIADALGAAAAGWVTSRWRF